jgi:hypothetical protein
MSYLSRASLLETLNLYNDNDYSINISFIVSILKKINVNNTQDHKTFQE